MVKEILKEAETRMTKSIVALEAELKSIRVGKASPALLDNIRVDYYGSKVPINQVANVSAPEPKLLIVQVWEKNMVEEIKKAILRSELGLNPNTDGSILRIPIPPMSEDRRKETVKLTKKLGEDNKVAIRNIRRDANESLKAAQKDKGISEDDQRKGQNQVQESTDKFIKKIDELIVKKEKEVMEV
ncbi:MAG: ribosome recycling factor [candidate division Zixibacteria bacterium CG_4_9_14_3_um_filter_46_8]|nr:MAG: ribosome recycling factor [candidate division Zixibacteria bacterium CG_4_9_14_3_um_filter_46_8]